MGQRFVFASVVIVIVSTVLVAGPGMIKAEDSQALKPSKGSEELMALQSTVQITMVGPKRAVAEVGDTNPKTYEIILVNGLGTLVNYAGQQLIITHDHWGLIDGEVEEVHISSADGANLASVSGTHFSHLIYYRDQGTMVLKAPTDLDPSNTMNAVAIDSPVDARPGDTVQIVHRDRNASPGLAVMTAVVEATENKQSVPAYVLRSLDGQALMPGDSGAGVWRDGKLVGNVWSRIREQVTLEHNWLFLTRTVEHLDDGRSRAAGLTAEVLSALPAFPERSPSPEGNAAGPS